MPTAIQDPAPDWIKQLRPENKSVLDPWWKSPARTVVSLLGLDDPQSQVMGIAAGVQTQEAAALLERFPRLAKVIKAFHGSPHDFEAFDISKIGTGEGAQAYGHGLYFAENPKVAEDYKRVLGHRAFKVGDRELVSPMGGSTRAEMQSRAENIAAESLDEAIMMHPSNPAVYATNRIRAGQYLYPEDAVHVADALRLVEQWQKTGEVQTMAGKMYEVGIHADPEHFVDLDKPLGQQSKAVQDAFRWYGIHDPSMHAMDAYNRLGGSEGIQGATRSLQELPHDYTPIPGLKYLDQQSRLIPDPASVEKTIADLQGYRAKVAATMAEDPDTTTRLLKDVDADISRYQAKLTPEKQRATRNYVVFDDKLISILKKYGIAAPAIEILRRKSQDQGGKLSESDLQGLY